MPAINSSSLLLLLSSLAVGCAAEGTDNAGPGGPGGGKSDDASEQGLFVTTLTTTLSPFNEIKWPVAVDDWSDADDKINEALSFEAVTGEKLEDLIAAWDTGGEGEGPPGTQAAYFDVNSNIRNVLSISITVETMAAYADFYFSHQNFNSNTGETIKITDLLSADALLGIAEELNSRLEREVALQRNRYSAEIASGEIDEAQWDGLSVTVDDLSSFSATEEGITFRWSAGFPHALVALEPDFSTSLTLEELDSAINPDGLWADEY